MSAILAIGVSDFKERARRFTFLVMIAAAVYAGYLYLPGAHAAYGTVILNGHRAIYNPAYVGVGVTVLTCTFLSGIGFFFVRGSVERDAELRVDGIAGGSGVTKPAFLIGKWLSNLAVLVAVAAVTYIAAAFVQLWQGEDRGVDVLAYAVPFVLATVPAMAFTAALAVVFDVVRPLRGIVGGVIYIAVVWIAMLIGSAQASHGFLRVSSLDPLGVTALVSQLYESEVRAAPADRGKTDIELGGTPAPARGFAVFAYEGTAWTPRVVAQRVAWFALSLLLVVAISPLFDLFRRNASGRNVRAFTLDVSRLVPHVPGMDVLRAEIVLLLNGANGFWLAGAALLVALELAMPLKTLAAFVLPVALIWPLERLSFLGVRERRFETFDVLAAAGAFNPRTIAMQAGAGAIVAAIPSLGYIVRTAAAGHFAEAAAFAAVAGTIAGCALFLGSATNAQRPFQAFFLMCWYLGPVQHLPALDVVSIAAREPAATISWSAAAMLAAVAATAALRRRPQVASFRG